MFSYTYPPRYSILVLKTKFLHFHRKLIYRIPCIAIYVNDVRHAWARTCWQVADDGSQVLYYDHEHYHGEYHRQSISISKQTFLLTVRSLQRTQPIFRTISSKFTLHIQFRSSARAAVRVYCTRYDFVTSGSASMITLCAQENRLFELLIIWKLISIGFIGVSPLRFFVVLSSLLCKPNKPSFKFRRFNAILWIVGFERTEC